jgi:hypothetical protein
VALAPFGGGPSLAITTVTFPGGNWTEVPFALTPSASTECEGIDVAAANKLGISCPVNGTYNPIGGMSDRTAHVCVKCGGQLTVTLTSGGEHHSINNSTDTDSTIANGQAATTTATQAHIGFASLMPGEWGKFQGLPVRADAVATLKQMGIRSIRQGGTFMDR